MDATKVGIVSLTDKNLSFYRTLHHFQRYGEFTSIEEFCKYCNWAKKNNINAYVLGNGSNTLFISKEIKTLVLKNRLRKEIKILSEYELEATSSVLVIDILKHCWEYSLDSFYYLSSVPATIGGALAMNAGRGKQHQLTIYDYVESVTFFDFESGAIQTLGKKEIVKGYRETIFTGIQSKLILSAKFKFKPTRLEANPISERLKWSKEFQDYSAPNCGSVFKVSDSDLMKKLRGLKVGKASFSKKTNNWILNQSQDSKSILILIFIVKVIHLALRKKAKLELIAID